MARRTSWGWDRALAVLGLLGALSACGDGHDGGSTGSSLAPAPACGWIPDDAREVTPVASLHAGSASDPMCATARSALDLPKEIAVSIERELRTSTRMSDAEERRIGARLEAALPRERAFAGKFDLPEDVQRYGGYLRDLVQRLAVHTTRPGIGYRVHLVHLPVCNAMALPGGAIVVFTGTLEGREAVRSEAELAGVLAHEITHIERRHVVAAYQFARAALGEETDEAVLAMQILTQPISTEHELEADERGMELAVLAQYDPQAIVNLWKRRIGVEAQHEPARGRGRGRRRGDAVDDVMESVEALLSSHPPATVRACHAMDKLAWAREHAPCDLVYDGRTNLRTRVSGPRHPY